MKRNVLVAFFLIGLVALEYGCKHEPIPPSNNSEDQCNRKTHQAVTDFAYVVPLTYLENRYEEIEPFDSIQFDELVIRTQLNTAYVMDYKPNFSSSSAYAVRAEPTEPICWDLNSIEIEGVSDSQVENLTSHFEVSPNYPNVPSIAITNDDAFRAEMKTRVIQTPLFLSFVMTKAPNTFDLKQIRIRCETKEGNTLEIMTIPFVLTN